MSHQVRSHAAAQTNLQFDIRKYKFVLISNSSPNAGRFRKKSSWTVRVTGAKAVGNIYARNSNYNTCKDVHSFRMRVQKYSGTTVLTVSNFLFVSNFYLFQRKSTKSSAEQQWWSEQQRLTSILILEKERCTNICPKWEQNKQIWKFHDKKWTIASAYIQKYAQHLYLNKISVKLLEKVQQVEDPSIVWKLPRTFF